jgi:hypothetical protein
VASTTTTTTYAVRRVTAATATTTVVIFLCVLCVLCVWFVECGLCDEGLQQGNRVPSCVHKVCFSNASAMGMACLNINVISNIVPSPHKPIAFIEVLSEGAHFNTIMPATSNQRKRYKKKTLSRVLLSSLHCTCAHTFARNGTCVLFVEFPLTNTRESNKQTIRYLSGLPRRVRQSHNIHNRISQSIRGCRRQRHLSTVGDTNNNGPCEPRQGRDRDRCAVARLPRAARAMADPPRQANRPCMQPGRRPGLVGHCGDRCRVPRTRQVCYGRQQCQLRGVAWGPAG